MRIFAFFPNNDSEDAFTTDVGEGLKLEADEVSIHSPVWDSVTRLMTEGRFKKKMADAGVNTTLVDEFLNQANRTTSDDYEKFEGIWNTLSYGKAVVR